MTGWTLLIEDALLNSSVSFLFLTRTARGHLREEQAGDAGHTAGYQSRHVRRQGKKDALLPYKTSDSR